MTEKFRFKDIIKRGTKLGIHPNDADALQWYRDRASEVSGIKTPEMIEPGLLQRMKEPFKRLNALSETSVGKMYMFIYDAKHKATLPWWDKYPLIVPIDYRQGSMLGLNFHYLTPLARANLLDMLMETMNNKKWDKTTKMKVTYKYLKGLSQYDPYVKQCIKMYLFTHVRSRFLFVHPTEWNIAIMLPTQQFVTNVSGYEKAIYGPDVWSKFNGV